MRGRQRCRGCLLVVKKSRIYKLNPAFRTGGRETADTKRSAVARLFRRVHGG
ncbi:MAG: hypothetical protein OXU61_02860 [Gammaproteobacteria bacterium]|nr:hypothetical protein [Gammaproteobacteria bacterium]